MLIAGEWQVGDDGVTRPIVRANVFGADGSPIADDFLVDSGADRTVDVLISRRRHEILLLAPRHRYRIVSWES
jgi:hypothetical protein